MNDFFNGRKWKKFLSENKKYSVEECGDPAVSLDKPPIDVPMDSQGPVHVGLEPDHEGEMARSQLMQASESATALMDMVQDGDELPAWVQSKLTKASDYLSMVRRYMEYQTGQGTQDAGGGAIAITMMEGADLSQYSDEAAEAATWALNQVPKPGSHSGAAIENEIHMYLEQQGYDPKGTEIFQVADEALAAAGVMLGLGPDVL
tara:strand:+ start:3797 stop:4408 length:612 start_codon:yes stop_codon:yes gene_type:complete